MEACDASQPEIAGHHRLRPMRCSAIHRVVRCQRARRNSTRRCFEVGCRTAGQRCRPQPRGQTRQRPLPLRVALLARAQTAGIEGFHLHWMRHSWASRWLASGGSEGGLMSARGGSPPKWLTAMPAILLLSVLRLPANCNSTIYKTPDWHLNRLRHNAMQYSTSSNFRLAFTPI